MSTGQKLAVLVGCNYPKSSYYKLNGCINDVKAMNDLLIGRLGFTGENITILTDDNGSESPNSPTLHNIKNALLQMFDRANEGDILFFYFSGNGTLFTPSPGKKNHNEGIPAIISSDLHAITAYHFRCLLHRVPDGAIFTLVSDSSFSGGLFNEDNQNESNVPVPVPGLRPKTIPSGVIQCSFNVQAQLPAVSSKFSSGSPPSSNCILIGSSNANQESVEVGESGDPLKAFGAYTMGIQMLFYSLRNMLPNALITPTNNEVVTIPRALLGVIKFNQQPYLYCSDKNADAPFLGAPGVA